MRQLARVRGQQQVPVRGQLRQVRVPVQQQEQVRGLVQVRGPKRRHIPWRQWLASKMNCASTDQQRFSRLLQKRYASC